MVSPADAYLEDDLVRLRNKSGSFEFTTGHHLGLDDVLLLSDHCFGHVFLFKK